MNKIGHVPSVIYDLAQNNRSVSAFIAKYPTNIEMPHYSLWEEAILSNKVKIRIAQM